MEGDEDELPEDKFQLRMPKNVNKYTGLPEPEEQSIPEGPLHTQLVRERDESSEFPEDRFHKKDATSQYIINQREQAVKDKWAKHEKEKAERADDPNVEYIDVDDFKPGGKYGPSKKESITTGSTDLGGNDELRNPESLLKASHIVKKGIAKSIDRSQADLPTSTTATELMSNLWSELLD